MNNCPLSFRQKQCWRWKLGAHSKNRQLKNKQLSPPKVGGGQAIYKGLFFCRGISKIQFILNNCPGANLVAVQGTVQKN